LLPKVARNSYCVPAIFLRENRKKNEFHCSSRAPNKERMVKARVVFNNTEKKSASGAKACFDKLSIWLPQQTLTFLTFI
jgi:hypothetical protein